MAEPAGEAATRGARFDVAGGVWHVAMRGRGSTSRRATAGGYVVSAGWVDEYQPRLSLIFR